MCAHHGRPWNKTFSFKPELLPRWKAQGVTRDHIYVVLRVIEKLMHDIAPKSRCKDRLIDHISKNPQVDLTAVHIPPD